MRIGDIVTYKAGYNHFVVLGFDGPEKVWCRRIQYGSAVEDWFTFNTKDLALLGSGKEA